MSAETRTIPADERSSAPGRGPWFLSVKGRQIYPFDLRPEDVDIEEIAHALSFLCRFNGHCRGFYSVAQHSVHVAEALPSELFLGGLLHDGTEAYCGDFRIRSPIKRALPGFVTMEDGIWAAIAARFGLPDQLAPQIKEADNRMLQTERRDLLADHPWPWTIDQSADGGAKPYPDRINPWTPEVARKIFLDAFRFATGGAA